MDLPLLVALFAFEAAGVVCALAAYKRGDRPFLPFLGTRTGGFLVAAAVTAACSALIVVGRVRSRGARETLLALAINLLVVATSLSGAEIGVRLLSSTSESGTSFLGRQLLPRDWGTTSAQYRQLLRKADDDGSFLVFDPVLGWSIAPNRTSADGLYHSSEEGIRSLRPGMHLWGAHTGPLIALVGDSFTFGLEVTYDASWGAQLERALGGRAAVRNFGVDGYGIDQAYLRYVRDVRPWKPDVVILALIDHDLERSMGVYGFLTFPDSYLPFPKPRMVVTPSGLEVINAPLPAPEAVFAKKAITALPFLEYDRGYDPAEWARGVRYQSYLLRALFPLWRRWPAAHELVSDGHLSRLNVRILQAFIGLATAEGSTPIVVYLPSRSRFIGDDGLATGERQAQRLLREASLPHVDMTACVSAVPPSERFVRLHYTRRANQALAECTVDLVERYLDGLPRSRTGASARPAAGAARARRISQ